TRPIIVRTSVEEPRLAKSRMPSSPLFRAKLVLFPLCERMVGPIEIFFADNGHNDLEGCAPSQPCPAVNHTVSRRRRSGRPPEDRPAMAFGFRAVASIFQRPRRGFRCHRILG